MLKIDEIDKKIIDELNKDARQSEEKIAKALKMSKQLVHYRITKLVKSRIILGFNAHIDLAMLGYPIGIHVFIKCSALDDRFMDDLKSIPNIVSIYRLSGAYDITLLIVAGSVDEADSVITKIREAGGKRIHQIEFFFKTSAAAGKKRKASQFIKAEKPDKKDIILLKEISMNSRARLKDLAKKTSLTPETVSIRLRKLKSRQLIRAYRVEVDHYKIYNTLFIILIKNTILYSDQKDRLQVILNNPGVISLHSYIGATNIVMALNDPKDAYQAINTIKNEFPEFGDFSFSVVLDNIKRDWSGLISETANMT